MAAPRMPALFVGHGSPMNAIEDNTFTQNWEEIARRLPRPETILAVSAHWYTAGSRLTDAAEPRMVYDMYGFPDELYRITYPAKGAPALAHETRALIREEVAIDNDWGYDHGTWAVLCRMYPQADIPVYQLSVDRNADARTHFHIGQEIAALRQKGVMIFGSGNVVHNLARIDWGMEDGGYPWAVEFDGYIKEKIVAREFESVIDHRSAGKSAELAFRTLDHYAPLLYVLGVTDGSDRLTVVNDSCTLGSISMTCYLFE